MGLIRPRSASFGLVRSFAERLLAFRLGVQTGVTSPQSRASNHGRSTLDRGTSPPNWVAKCPKAIENM